MQRTITWQLPTVVAQQRPIAKTIVDYRVKVTSGTPLPWTNLVDVPASAPQSTVIDDPAAGTFEYQFTVQDVDGKDGAPLIVEKTLGSSAPGQVTNVTITDA